MSKRGIIGFLTALSWTAQFANGQLQPDCNPLHTDCPSKKAWPEENYYIDFTKQKGPPSDWTIANSEVVDFTSNGAELSYAKKGDAPNMWTDFYMLGGRYDVEMKIAPGQGVISSAALWSDTQDEIDFEFSGNQFGQTPFPPRDGMWAFETNVFAQGKMWDGAATYQKDLYKPAEQFHKYSVEWDEDYMNWYVDDKVVRSILAKDTPKGFAFPQSPMKLQLGVWGGGDPNNNHWTIQWAGGEVDMKGAPYTMYVKSVNITNKYPACQYRYKDKSGKQASIEKLENGCNPELVKMAKRDPAANNYPVSSPDFIDTPAPTSYYPTQGIGTSNTAGTDAIASSAPGAYPNITKPGTTVTLGNYFTTVIEYDTITPEAPASVSSGATPTSYYTASQASTDVSSYQMSESSSTVGTATTSVPVAVSSASSYPVASSQTAPKNAPGESSHVDNDLTTVTSPTTDTRTVFQTQSPEKSGTCECVPSTVTVTQTVARVTVTSTAEPFIASTYSMGTAPLGTGGLGEVMEMGANMDIDEMLG
ncbi:putative glycosidase crf1 [Daldinia childiae]|uniref:putative glycosidase crf1 n=1 Tax=Daldinia childiae TaxID=326645 RepID=UPI001447DC2E|nr:putative glycosidase crf1 [Daldinia childiae]KAF3059421.1 putative glycosidase crf1 [Daldinia childiae]